MSPSVALTNPFVILEFCTGSKDEPFAKCIHALPENVENATMSSSPSPFKSPTEIEVALSQVCMGVEVVIPLPAFQSAQRIDVELFD